MIAYFFDFFGDFLATFLLADVLPAAFFRLKAASQPSEYF